jgi:hypothetical protein
MKTLFYIAIATCSLVSAAAAQAVPESVLRQCKANQLQARLTYQTWSPPPERDRGTPSTVTVVGRIVK